MAAVVLGCVLVVAFVLWIWRSDIWPLPMTVLNSSITVDGEDREYRLVIPDSVGNKSLIPVVFALHGAFGTTSEMAKYTDLDRLAVQEGFLLVYLQGRHLSWPPSISPENPHVMVPDIRFFETMCDVMVSEHHADPSRIYVVGVSQGGAMANALTVQCSQRIAATVCCCGWLPEPLGDEPLKTQHKCPMLFIAGTQDNQVSPANVRAASDAFDRAGHPVEFWLIEGFGHGWPKSQNENQRIWDFLHAHRLPAP
jgi:poly(3-hydroxybutyrate) depolymerase